jgi:hypothetical protein
MELVSALLQKMIAEEAHEDKRRLLEAARSCSADCASVSFSALRHADSDTQPGRKSRADSR